MRTFRFWTYILTNWNRTVLYTGITNDLATRLVEHWVGKEGCFTTRYKVHYLVWSEETKYVNNAIDREKAIKRWHRSDKESLIAELNPEWKFWNEDIVGNWPPTDEQMQIVKERWHSIGEAGLMKDGLSFHRQVSRYE
jgi:putative endonuclease